MMHSNAGDDADFPSNPFRPASNQPPAQQGDAQQTPLNQFYATEAPQVFSQTPQQSIPMAAVPQQSNPIETSQPQFQQGAPSNHTQPSPVTNQSFVQNETASTSGNTAQLSRYQICMSCFKMETYITYFDIDTHDFFNRIKYSMLMFYLPDKFRSEVIGVARTENLKGPDLYGPLWITMTLVFFVAVTSNISAYFRADDMEEFEYDISHLLHAMAVCFTFVFGVPSIWWLMTQCLGMQALMMVDWICLYGYSMVPYLPSTLLCLIPFHPWIWICLIVATVMSLLLVARNVASTLLAADTGSNKAGPLLMAIIATHIIFFIVLKLTFYE
mmetsp:Transcript_16231/g.23873  ORF Transcript_16231/g.23873 Transcript_16231/m.23873 type:complete len:328 (-) Transcript_16231:316-1299(-)